MTTRNRGHLEASEQLYFVDGAVHEVGVVVSGRVMWVTWSRADAMARAAETNGTVHLVSIGEFEEAEFRNHLWIQCGRLLIQHAFPPGEDDWAPWARPERALPPEPYLHVRRHDGAPPVAAGDPFIATYNEAGYLRALARDRNDVILWKPYLWASSSFEGTAPWRGRIADPEIWVVQFVDPEPDWNTDNELDVRGSAGHFVERHS